MTFSTLLVTMHFLLYIGPNHLTISSSPSLWKSFKHFFPVSQILLDNCPGPPLITEPCDISSGTSAFSTPQSHSSFHSQIIWLQILSFSLTHTHTHTACPKHALKNSQHPLIIYLGLKSMTTDGQKYLNKKKTVLSKRLWIYICIILPARKVKLNKVPLTHLIKHT